MMKNNYSPLFIAMASALAMLSLPAAAHKSDYGDDKRGAYEKHERHGKRWLKRADTDNDRLISLEEATAMGEKMFKRFDDNNDNVISEDELPKRRYKSGRIMRFLELSDTKEINKKTVMEKIARIHKAADDDKDGKLSVNEIRAFAQLQRFKRLDANNDGNISQQEFLDFRERMNQKRK